MFFICKEGANIQYVMEFPQQTYMLNYWEICIKYPIKIK
jgi:hypothetical protein